MDLDIFRKNLAFVVAVNKFDPLGGCLLGVSSIVVVVVVCVSVGTDGQNEQDRREDRGSW